MERYLRWLATGAVSVHESTKADWKKQARPKGVRPAIANNWFAVGFIRVQLFRFVFQQSFHRMDCRN
jgi:hypothetical protein